MHATFFCLCPRLAWTLFPYTCVYFVCLLPLPVFSPAEFLFFRQCAAILILHTGGDTHNLPPAHTILFLFLLVVCDIDSHVLYHFRTCHAIPFLLFMLIIYCGFLLIGHVTSGWLPMALLFALLFYAFLLHFVF